MDSAMIASLLSYGNIAIKLAVGLIGFLWVLRTTNRCQLAQMTPVDLIGNFVMGGIIGGVIYNQDITTVQFIIVLAIWQLLVLGVNALRIHTESGQKMIVGRPTPVVIKGKYLQDKFELLGLDIADFATLSRIQGVHSLYDIWNAQIEPNGQATIQKKDARKTSNILITNGTIDTGALEMMEKDEGWLKNELHKRGYESYKDIFLPNGMNLLMMKGEKPGNCISLSARKKRLKRILPERNALQGDAMRNIPRSFSYPEEEITPCPCLVRMKPPRATGGMVQGNA